MNLFTPIRPALLALIQNIAESGTDAYWRDQINRYAPQGTKTVFKLSLGPTGRKGLDDAIVNEYDASKPLGQEMTENVAGYRLFTLKVLCECLLQGDDSTAWGHLELIATRIQWSTSKAQLNAVNVGFVRISDLQDLSRMIDGRQASIASIDIRLSTRTNERNPQGNGYIDTVNIPEIQTS